VPVSVLIVTSARLDEDHFEYASAARDPMRWTERAACIDVDLARFFAERVERGHDTRWRLYCGRCVVRAECLRTALDNGFGNGIWGGLTAAERRGMR
jgi:WhiB family redox-sensing transcriptional regulator